jgi:hypothetical protein
MVAIPKRKGLCCNTFHAQAWHDRIRALTCGNKVFTERAREPPSEPWAGGGWWLMAGVAGRRPNAMR